jgi:hypothetical protein
MAAEHPEEQQSRRILTGTVGGRRCSVIHVTFSRSCLWQSSIDCRKMGPLMDVLSTLRNNLEHFENSPDFGDGETVDFICRHLHMRIREAEGLARIQECEAMAERTAVLRTEAA